MMDSLSDMAIDIINELHTERLEYYSEYNPLIEAAHKLAAFEDTGLDPARVAELAQAERDGWLMVLPCKIGDTVYKIDIDPELLDKSIESYIVANYVICDDGDVLIKYDAHDGIICTVDNLINKTPYLDYYLCFLTYAEAESALARKEGGNNNE